MSDEPFLLRPVPTLELLLPVDCFIYIVEGFVVHQTMAAVLFTKAIHKAIFVLEGSATQVVGHSDVKHTRFAGDDVDRCTGGLS